MSSAGKSIKVVKRKQRQTLATQNDKTLSLVKTERQLRREMVQTVGTWIAELREERKKPSSNRLIVSNLC